MSKNEKKSLWKEFTEFAIKGNAMALAVGTIIGGAFSTITKSLTDHIIMPIVNMFLGGIEFSEMKKSTTSTESIALTITSSNCSPDSMPFQSIQHFTLALRSIILTKGSTCCKSSRE